jgi:hypothetical protein
VDIERLDGVTVGQEFREQNGAIEAAAQKDSDGRGHEESPRCRSARRGFFSKNWTQLGHSAKIPQVPRIAAGKAIFPPPRQSCRSNCCRIVFASFLICRGRHVLTVRLANVATVFESF